MKYLPIIIGFTLALLATDITLAQRPIDLLETLPDGTSQIMINQSDPLPPLSILNAYLRPFIPWAIGTSAGLAVLMIIIGGFQIMLGGGGDIKSSPGAKKILSAILGLMILVFSSVILNWLNAHYFQLV